MRLFWSNIPTTDWPENGGMTDEMMTNETEGLRLRLGLNERKY